MIEYLPPFLREYLDFQCLMGQYQTAFAERWAQVKTLEDELYLLTAGHTGLTRWERILGLRHRGHLELEERRREILARLSVQIPYSISALHRFLTVLLGNRDAYTLQLSEWKLEIGIRQKWMRRKGVVLEMLQSVVPANIEICVTPIIAAHESMQEKSHLELKGFTHWQLKNEGVGA